MIFAELQYDQPYSDAHSSLVTLLGRHFKNLESGLQGDSWIWILDNGLKVSVDTFSSELFYLTWVAVLAGGSAGGIAWRPGAMHCR